jgi:Family of unknown function (DUF6433)
MAENNANYVHEVLNLVHKAKTSKEKVDILKNNSSMALKNVLFGTFDDSIQWNLPEGEPPYRPAEPNSAPSTLQKQLNALVYFIKGNKGDALAKFKRESMFISLLESIHPEDAKVVLAMVSKKLPTKGLTKAVVKEAFPDLIRN